ncbi:MAG: DNA polymerase III subunit gamma/tau [Hydrotalea sp.]|nr:DNA polymerase III subunit gamma/tau [Hydrotalea sp.]
MSDTSHLVLARKYRPKVFDELIGQEQLVRVLRNSFKMNKVAHGYILTGVRGVGKTTTARIIAKTLNCEKNKNKAAGAPIEDPCGTCDQCVAIAEYRHVDVQEMDAASNNRVDDVRAIIDSVGYRPVLGQYRVYILDEAHMITTQAFNALLKTLEEPPPHLIFILATTEVQKIPATILSRCVRFDLRRVSVEQLTAHFKSILQKENITMSDSAITLIARAAEGSVRDGLSMLDQAIALNPSGVGEDDVLAMLGLSDITKIYHLLHHLMAGDAPSAMAQYHDLITLGGAPEMIIEQLMAAVHVMTKMALDEDYKNTNAISETEKNLSYDLLKKLSLPIMARVWQMLLRGLGEVRVAPDAITATEMLLIRLMLVGDAPTPDELIKTIKANPNAAVNNAPSVTASPEPAPSNSMANMATEKKTAEPAITQSPIENNQTQDNLSFEDLVAMVAQKNMMLATNMRSNIRLIDYQFPVAASNSGGVVTFEKINDASVALAEELKKYLSKTTDSIWQIAAVAQPGMPTLDERLYEKIANNQTIKLARELFPAAKIIDPKLNINKK